jgi:hypothetical protein
MVYREHGMWEIREVLSRLSRGESQAHVAAATRLGRKTIRRYLRLARELGWRLGDAEPDEAFVARVLDRVRPGPKRPEPGESEKLLFPQRDQIREWLSGSENQKGLRLTKVHRLLVRRGIEVPYSSLHRFAVKYCEFGKGQVTVRCAPCQPGELSEIDFGRLGYIVDPQTHRRRLVWALVVVLVYSRHMYVHVTHRQTLEAIIDGLEAAWEFFDGVSARVILDNVKSAITKPDRYDPVFQRTFNDYAEHRGFVIDPAAVYHPKGKPHVERQVPYVRDNFFRGEDFLDLDHVQREAIRWCLEVAGTRVHGTTRRRPLAVFEDEEKKALRPVCGLRFDTPHWAECSVHPDHHVQFGKALYSVPTAYRRKTVTVRGDRSLVRIYFRGKLIKTHQPQEPGGRSTDYNDYPKEISDYARRDPDYMIGQAKTRGPSIGRFTERLLAGDFPWAKLRQAQKLLRLVKKYGSSRLDEACARALAFDLINVRRVESILLDALRRPAKKPPGRVTPLPTLFLRPEGSFTHPSPTRKETSTDGDQGVTESRAQETEALGDPGDTPRPRGVRQEGETDSR